VDNLLAPQHLAQGLCQLAEIIPDEEVLPKRRGESDQSCPYPTPGGCPISSANRPLVQRRGFAVAKTDRIAFVLDPENKDLFELTWDKVSIVGNLMEEEADLVPVRYRVRMFPNESQLAQLRGISLFGV